jgi:hypothetical protein
MATLARIALAFASFAFLTACGGSPTEPTRQSTTYAGQWSGNGLGLTVSFTVSPDDKITALSIGYNFSGCSGTVTRTDLNLDMVTTTDPRSNTPRPSFGWGSAQPDFTNYVQLFAWFDSHDNAHGTITMGDMTGCPRGSFGGGIFTAAKRQ